MDVKIEARSRASTGGWAVRVFDTVEAASVDTGVMQTSVLACLRDSTLQAGKWRFGLVPADEIFKPMDRDEALKVAAANLTAKELTESLLESFIRERINEAPGHLVRFGDFYTRFQEWLPSEARAFWSKQKVSRSLPTKFASGIGNDNKVFIINASFERKQLNPNVKPYCITNGRVKRCQ